MINNSIAKLIINGELMGTAWLIDHQFAITAAHYFDNDVEGVTLSFPTVDLIAVALIEKDVQLDVALLKLEQTQNKLQPLKISKRPTSAQHNKWEAHGYPGVIIDRFNAGITIGGEVRNFWIQFKGVSTIQLLCNEGVNEIDFQAPNLGGMSGAPVIIQNNRVVGMIRYAPPEFGEKILVATPVDVVAEKFPRYFLFNSADDSDSIPKTRETSSLIAAELKLQRLNQEIQNLENKLPPISPRRESVLVGLTLIFSCFLVLFLIFYSIDFNLINLFTRREKESHFMMFAPFLAIIPGGIMFLWIAYYNKKKVSHERAKIHQEIKDKNKEITEQKELIIKHEKLGK